MKFFKICAGLLVCLLLGGLVTLSKADSPTTSSTPTPVKGNFDPGPVRAAEARLDSASASITQLTLITPTLLLTSSTVLPPKTAALGTSGRQTPLRAGPGEIGAADVYFIGVEDFEGIFPQPNWTLNDDGGTGHNWGDVPCFPLEDAFEGFWSGWPASRGSNGLNPCIGNNYPNGIETWLIYGPFSLQNVQYSDVQFFFRMISEQDFDFLFWGASTDGANFSGFETSGIHISGPYNNGYNEVIFDLIPQLGQPQVWIGFQFRSDNLFNAQGPFIDGINILVEEIGTKTIFLPVIINPSPPNNVTMLYITNTTSGNVIFTVMGTPQGNITCNVPAGQTLFCGQFTAGTYNATSNAAACPPPTTKSKTFEAGAVTLTVRCK